MVNFRVLRPDVAELSKGAHPEGMGNYVFNVAMYVDVWGIRGVDDLWALAAHLNQRFFEDCIKKDKNPWKQQRAFEYIMKPGRVHEERAAERILGPFEENATSSGRRPFEVQNARLVNFNNIGRVQLMTDVTKNLKASRDTAGLPSNNPEVYWWPSGNHPEFYSYVSCFLLSTTNNEMCITLHSNPCRLSMRHFREVVARFVELLHMATAGTGDLPPAGGGDAKANEKKRAGVTNDVSADRVARQVREILMSTLPRSDYMPQENKVGVVQVPAEILDEKLRP